MLSLPPSLQSGPTLSPPPSVSLADGADEDDLAVSTVVIDTSPGADFLDTPAERGSGMHVVFVLKRSWGWICQRRALCTRIQELLKYTYAILSKLRSRKHGVGSDGASPV